MSRFAAHPLFLGKTIALDTQVHFDPGLIQRLLLEHRDVNARLAALVARIGLDPSAEPEVADCAARFSAIRRTEAVCLYPLIARAIAGDDDAERQFLRLRLVMLRLSRRVLRLLDDLSHAIRLDAEVNLAADLAASALAEYCQRNQVEIYPLYELVGGRSLQQRTLHAG